MKVLVKPAFTNKEKNPYNYLLYTQLVENNACEVEEFTPQKAFFGRYDILHIHWPEVMLSDRSAVLSLLTTIAFLLLMQWMKLRGTRVVWTVHDLRSHKFVLKNAVQQKIEQWYWDKFNHRLDAIIALSNASLEGAIKHHPVLAKKQHFVIPHGHYKDIYPDTISREQARKKLSIPEDELLISYFGQVRPYKNVPHLVKTFLSLDDNNYRLLIAGNPATRELKGEIESIAEKNSEQITTILKFIPDEEVQDIFRASDLVVIPYKDILNSGSAILSLSFDTPVLVPEKGSIIELKEIFGDRWIKTYSEELTADILEKHIQGIAKTERTKCEKIEEFGWDKIARQTFEAYRQLVS